MSPVIIIVIVIAALVFVGFGARAGLKAHAKKMLGPVDFSISTQSPGMGETMEYELHLNPTGALHINSVTVFLRGYEWIRWTETQSYTDSKGNRRTRTVTKTRTHDFYNMACPLRVNRRVTVGETISNLGSFEVPRQGPSSMHASDNRIIWVMTTDVDIKNLPDITQQYPVKVRPVLVAS